MVFGSTNVLLNLRQPVGNTFVAIDTGLTFVECLLVCGRRTFVLLRVIHVREVVAVAALSAVSALHAIPLMLG